MKQTARFIAPDQLTTLTIVAAPGKKGFNLKATLKEGKGKGAPPAKPGCRATFKTQKEVDKAFVVLVDESKKRGWKEVEMKSRNAFSVIPEAPKSPKAATGK